MADMNYYKLSRIEVFMPVEGHEDYEVSNFGRIRHVLKSGKVVNINPTNNDWRGYKRVMLYKDGKRTPQYVHRLVAKAFVQGYEEGLTVNHIDEFKGNNNFLNLEWMTIGDNVRYSLKGRKRRKQM